MGDSGLLQLGAVGAIGVSGFGDDPVRVHLVHEVSMYCMLCGVAGVGGDEVAGDGTEGLSAFASQDAHADVDESVPEVDAVGRGHDGSFRVRAGGLWPPGLRWWASAPVGDLVGDVGQAGVDLARASRQVVLFGEGFDGVEAFR